MEMVEEISLEFFQILIQSIRSKGIDGTLKILRTEIQEVEIEDEYIMNVAKSVCEEFTIGIDEIVYGKYVRGDNKYIIGFIIYYLYKDYSIGELQRKGLFKHKHKSVLSRYRQLIDELDAKHKTDMPYIKIKDKLDKKIQEIKK